MVRCPRTWTDTPIDMTAWSRWDDRLFEVYERLTTNRRTMDTLPDVCLYCAAWCNCRENKYTILDVPHDCCLLSMPAGSSQSHTHKPSSAFKTSLMIITHLSYLIPPDHQILNMTADLHEDFELIPSPNPPTRRPNSTIPSACAPTTPPISSNAPGPTLPTPSSPPHQTQPPISALLNPLTGPNFLEHLTRFLLLSTLPFLLLYTTTTTLLHCEYIAFKTKRPLAHAEILWRVRRFVGRDLEMVGRTLREIDEGRLGEM